MANILTILDKLRKDEITVAEAKDRLEKLW
jgi:hypothetical protein